MTLQCEYCSFETNRLFKLKRHLRIKHNNFSSYAKDHGIQTSLEHSEIICPLCNISFKDNIEYIHHVSYCDGKSVKCYFCENIFYKRKIYDNHLKSGKCLQIGRGRLPVLPENGPFKLSKKAFKAFLQQYELNPEEDFKNINEFFLYYKEEIQNLINSIMQKLPSIKIQFCLQVSFIREIDETSQIGYFCSLADYLSNIQLFDDLYNSVINEIDEKVTEFEGQGSGWKIDKIDRLDIRIGLFKPLYGGCKTFNLPKHLERKNAIINIEGDDNKCFIRCIIAHLFPRKKNKYSQKYFKDKETELNTTGIKYPVSLQMIKKFEKDNKHHDIRINVFGWSTAQNRFGEVVPIQISKTIAGNTINLMLIENHYYYIKNFNHLIGTSGGSYHHFCENCLQGFVNEEKLKIHGQNCQFFNPSRVILPRKGENILKFTEIKQMMEYPFVIYADFETILKKIDNNLHLNSRPYEEHIACGYSLVIVNSKGHVEYSNYYRGENAAKEFLHDLKKSSEKFIKIQQSYTPMNPLTSKEIEDFENATECYLCNKKFNLTSEDGFIDIKVHDHCHITGNYH